MGVAQVPTSGVSQEDGAVMVQEGKEGWAKDLRKFPKNLSSVLGGLSPELERS